MIYCYLYCTISLKLIGPLSHASTEESSDRSSFVEERQDDFVPPEDDPILQQTTVVVKAVMELSNKVPLSRPSDYVEFVKVREGVGREEEERNQILMLLMSDMFICLCRMSVRL